MDMTLLTDIPFRPDLPALARALCVDPDGEDFEELVAFVATAPAAAPMACHARVAVELPPDSTDAVLLGGVAFKSALLREQLAEQQAAYPYLATCGRALYTWETGVADPFQRYWAEALLQAALDAARDALEADFRAHRYAGTVASMNPGSLAEWPIDQQAPLFALLADAARALGMSLNASWLIEPNKSVSGVWFPNAHGYVNCKLCPRERCPSRRAPYEADTADALRAMRF